MKLFKTSDIHLVAECQELFGFDLPSVQLARRTKKFLEKFDIYWKYWNTPVNFVQTNTNNDSISTELLFYFQR